MTKYKWLNRWISKDMSGVHIFVGVLLVTAYAVGELLHDSRFMSLGQFGIFFLILLQFLHMHYHSCYQFLQTHLDSDQIPKAQMKRVNGIYLLLFLLFTGILMLALPSLWGKPLLRMLRQLLIAILTWLAALLPQASQEPVPVESSTVEPLQNFLSEPAGNANPLLIKLLDMAIGVVTAAMVILLVGFLLSRLYRLLCRLLAPKVYDDDEKIYLAPDFLSKKMEKKKGAEIPLWRDITVNAKVRRLYKRKILKLTHHKTPLPGSATPDELETIAGFDKSRKAYHELYEKARYGNKALEKEEIEQMVKE